MLRETANFGGLPGHRPWQADLVAVLGASVDGATERPPAQERVTYDAEPQPANNC